MAAFDFVQNVDPDRFAAAMRQPAACSCRECLKEWGVMFRGHSVEFGGFTLLILAHFSIAFMLPLLPGICLAVGGLLLPFLIIDQRREFWQAMETGRKIVTKSWSTFFGFAFVLFLLSIAGMPVFGVCLLLGIPVMMCALAAAYRHVAGIRSLSW